MVVPAVYVSSSYHLVLTIVVSGIRVLFQTIVVQVCFFRSYAVTSVVASDHTSLVMVTCVILIECVASDDIHLRSVRVVRVHESVIAQFRLHVVDVLPFLLGI